MKVIKSENKNRLLRLRLTLSIAFSVVLFPNKPKPPLCYFTLSNARRF